MENLVPFSQHPLTDPITIVNVRTAQSDSCGYVGGWSLRAPSPGHCPAKASKPCGQGTQLRCCPPELECRGENDYFGCYCCLPGEDCVPRVLESPKCPTQDWPQWAINGSFEIGGFCCLAGLKGFSVRFPNNTFTFGCASPKTHLAENESWAIEMAPLPCAIDTQTNGPDNTTSRNNGLATGQIVGLVVGVIFGVALAMAGAWFLLRKRRSRAGDDTSKHEQGEDKTLAGAGEDAAVWPAWRHFSDASTAVPQEMDPQRWAQEMEDRSTVMPPELPPLVHPWRHNSDYECVLVPSNTHSSLVSPLTGVDPPPREVSPG